jgi:hypothetical protein
MAVSLPGEGATAQVMTTDQADAIEASGVDVFVRDGKAYLLDPAGRQAIVPEQAAPSLLSKGYRPQDEMEVLEQDIPALGTAEAFLAHGVNTMYPGSFAGGDRPDMFLSTGRHALQRAEEEHPLASGAGKVAGVFGSMVGPGGVGSIVSQGAQAAGARAGAAAARGVTKALGGQAAVDIARHMPGAVGKTRHLLSRSVPAAERVSAWGVQGAVEGSALAVQQEAAASSVHPERTVNDALAGIFSGALIGGAGGVVLGAGSAGVRSLAQRRALKAAAKRQEALRKSIDEATAGTIEKLDKARADLRKYWSPVDEAAQGVGLGYRPPKVRWEPPRKMALAAGMRARAAELLKMSDDEMRRVLSRADSWERRALELSRSASAKQKAAAKEAASLRADVDKQSMYLELQPKSRRDAALSPLKKRAKEVVAEAKAEADAVEPTVSFLRKQAEVTVDKAKKARSQLASFMTKRAKELEKEVDAVATSSGFPVSKLQEKVAELDVQLRAARGQALEKFQRTYQPESTKISGIGRFMAQSALVRAGAGGAVGGVPGALAGALVGRAPQEVAARVAKAVGRTVARGARAVGRNAGARAVGKVVAIRSLSYSPSDDDIAAVLSADPKQLEETARSAAEQAGLAFGIDEGLQQQAAAKNIQGLLFLQAKGKEIFE